MYNFYITDILQPSNKNTKMSENINLDSNKTVTPVQIVGSTWTAEKGKLNIDFDNLLSSNKNKNSGPTLSMNQLKTQSPVKSPPNTNVVIGQQQQNFGGIIQPSNNFSNPPINQFNAFQ